MRRRRGGVGFSLVETLVALAILGAGILALTGLQMGIARQAAAVREQMQATRHAQQAIEQARSFDALVGASGASATGFGAFDGLVDRASIEAASTSKEGFTVARRWTGDASAPWRELMVTVSWKDRLGAASAVDLRTVLARSSPTRLADASLQAPIDPALRPMGRHPAIPLHAVRRGDGTSALPWAGASAGSLIVDDLSAEVVGVCEASVAAGSATLSRASATATATTTATARATSTTGDSLQPCLATSGDLLSGYIGIHDDRDRASTAALPPDLAIAFTEPEFIVGTPDCAPMVTVANVPAGALDRPRFYICLVRPSDHDHRPDTPMVWSARVNLSSLRGLAGRTVCRYSKSADETDNRKHPDTYRLVAAALHNQNFVVTAPGSDCPAGTVLHQRP